MNNFWLCFIPLFAAVDTLGVLPIFINLTEGFSQKMIKKIVLHSIITASIVGLLFIFFGNIILNYLGITIGDFMIAGGLLLFIISINDILAVEKKRRSVDPNVLGAVPIGVPLIVGPAVLTISLILINQYGIITTSAAIIANIIIAGLIFLISRPIYKILGNGGTKTLSKLANILLAALSVMMIRKGILVIIQKILG